MKSQAEQLIQKKNAGFVDKMAHLLITAAQNPHYTRITARLLIRKCDLFP
jgi:hypothetical protein